MLLTKTSPDMKSYCPDVKKSASSSCGSNRMYVTNEWKWNLTMLIPKPKLVIKLFPHNKREAMYRAIHVVHDNKMSKKSNYQFISLRIG